MISVDTWRASVGDAACAAGADLLNDAWGGADPELVDVAAAHGAAIVCTHTGGVTPRTRPYRIEYDDVVLAAIDDTVAYAERALAAGVDRESIVIDPAHDFGKNTFHSLELTRRLGEMVDTGWPVLVSLSNKDFVGETLDLPVGERLTGTLAATAICALAGARIYRVHQVVETRQTVDMVNTIAGRRLPKRAIRGIVTDADAGSSSVGPGVARAAAGVRRHRGPGRGAPRRLALDAVAWLGPGGHGAGRRAGCPGGGVPAGDQGPGRRRAVVPRGRQRLGDAHREGARPLRRAGRGLRRGAGASLRAGRPAVDVDLARELWASVDAIVALGDLDDDLGEGQVDYDDAPYGVQYWVVRWNVQRAERPDATPTSTRRTPSRRGRGCAST